MRLIDADALKAHLRELGWITDDPFAELGDLEEIVDSAPTVFNCNACKNAGNERECVDCHDYSNFVHYGENPRWIPCSETLPEKQGQYYVSGGDKVWICDFLIFSNLKGGWCNDVSNPVVEAWMPLPEPYKGGE